MNKMIMLIFICLFSFSVHLSASDENEMKDLFLNVLEDFEKLKNLPENGENFTISAILKTEEKGEVLEEGPSINHIAGDSKVSIYEDALGRKNVYFSRDHRAWVFREGLRLPIQVSYSVTVAGDADLWQILGQSLIGDYNFVRVSTEGDLLKGELEAIEEENVPYPYIDVYANPGGNIIEKIIFKSTNKRALKETVFSEYKMISRKYRFPVYTIRNLILNKDVVTEIRYTSVENHDFPQSFFQPDARSLNQFLRSRR